MTHYYQASGRFSPLAIVYFVLLAFIAFPIIGLIYAYAIWYIPFIYINILLTAGFGLAIGGLTGFVVISLGKVRNTMLALLLGILGGVLALYFHWAAWVDLVINAGESYGSDRIGITLSNVKLVQVMSLAANPGILFELIGEINAVGTWGLRGGTVSGLLLSVVWLIEALIVLGLSTYLPYTSAQHPFSEMANDWMESEELPAFEFIEDKDTFRAQLEQSNPEALQSLQIAQNLDLKHSVFTLYSSTAGENYVNVDNKTATTDNDGKTQLDSDTFIKGLSIEPELLEVLRKRSAGQSDTEASKEA